MFKGDREQERTAVFKAHETGRDKTLCGICGQKMTDGTNATEFKIS